MRTNQKRPRYKKIEPIPSNRKSKRLIERMREPKRSKIRNMIIRTLVKKLIGMPQK